MPAAHKLPLRVNLGLFSLPPRNLKTERSATATKEADLDGRTTAASHIFILSRLMLLVELGLENGVWDRSMM